MYALCGLTLQCVQRSACPGGLYSDEKLPAISQQLTPDPDVSAPVVEVPVVEEVPVVASPPPVNTSHGRRPRTQDTLITSKPLTDAQWVKASVLTSFNIIRPVNNVTLHPFGEVRGGRGGVGWGEVGEEKGRGEVRGDRVNVRDGYGCHAASKGKG